MSNTITTEGFDAFVDQTCESPIEASLLRAIISTSPEQVSTCLDKEDIIRNFLTWDGKICIAAQVKQGSYRLDLVLALRIEDRIHWLAIECDGHDWHDRTKEQAAADRKKDRGLQRLGYDIFRFTGREIWRTADSCAAEIFAWIEAIRARQ